VFVSPTVVGDAVIIGSCAGSLYALDRMTGKPIWQYDTKADGSRAQFHGEPLILGKRVVIPSDSDPKGHLYSFDVASGDLLWKRPFDHGVATTPLLIDGRIVAVSAQGEVVAVEPTHGNVVWHEAQAGAYALSPASAATRVFVADNVDKILALDARSGAVRWSRETPKEWTTYRPLVTGSTVIVGSEGKDLCAFDRDNGALRWCRSVGQIPRGLGISADGILYVGSLSGVVQAFRVDR